MSGDTNGLFRNIEARAKCESIYILSSYIPEENMSSFAGGTIRHDHLTYQRRIPNHISQTAQRVGEIHDFDKRRTYDILISRGAGRRDPVRLVSTHPGV